jgi:hypothetical protein
MAELALPETGRGYLSRSGIADNKVEHRDDQNERLRHD